MSWDSMIWFAAPAVLLWLFGAWAALRARSCMAVLLTAAGIVVFGCYIGLMWASLERPPLRTMGETRLWYSFLLSLAGLITYLRWKYKWILGFSTVLAIVFICINILRPEIHNKTLMPALQSPWFAPHVIIYMFAYAMLGAAAVTAIYLLIVKGKKSYNKSSNAQYEGANEGGESLERASKISSSPDKELALCDNLVSVGLAFMTIGMLFGALWAKEAWGHYWSWDPKETWAAITWFSFLAYIHVRISFKTSWRTALCILLISFVFLQMCWWGVNYLPSAQGVSVHTYNIST